MLEYDPRLLFNPQIKNTLYCSNTCQKKYYQFQQIQHKKIILLDLFMFSLTSSLFPPQLSSIVYLLPQFSPISAIILGRIILLLNRFVRMPEWRDYGRGFVGGAFSGWAQVLVMQPFEIIKVRLVNQSLANPEYKGIYDCFRKIAKQEGYSSFYKGTMSPLLGYSLQGAIAFGCNELFKTLISRYTSWKSEILPNGQPQTIMPMKYILLSGVFTGVASSLIITPADVTRILVQMQTNNGKYKGSIDAGINIFRRHGLRGLYIGFNVTLLRQILALATYFYSYEHIMRMFAPQGQSSAGAPVIASFAAGSIAGCNSWLFTYPIDYVKTVMQSQDLDKRQFKGGIDCMRTQYRKEGYRTFFKGLGITLVRSIPVNGVAFFSYEYLMRTMNWKTQ